MALCDEILSNSPERVEAWLRGRSDEINEIDRYGFTPLIEAAVVNNTDIARILIQWGAQVNQDDSTGNSPLHWAVENNNLEMTKLLLEKGANPNAFTYASQPILTKPLLRNQKPLKELLYAYRADVKFAQDFINTKLIGHRFELIGQVDIVNNYGDFVELDYEGFFLEFTLNLIQNSLQRYRNNFAARHMRHYFRWIKMITAMFGNANDLLKYQQYLVDVKRYSNRIDDLLKANFVLIPVAHRGHAIIFIKMGNYLALCDRGERSKTHGSVNIYRVGEPRNFNNELFKELLYKTQSPQFIDTEIFRLLKLTPEWQLPIKSQISGNCSWANVEAAVPTVLFFLMLLEKKKPTDEDIIHCKNAAMEFYHDWHEWDKNIALHECIEQFYNSNVPRQASKVAVMGSILFQNCKFNRLADIERAKRMMPVLTLHNYRYVLDSYLDVYWREKQTKLGLNLTRILQQCGIAF